MNDVSQFRRIENIATRLQIKWDGKTLDAAKGESVAACLLANGVLNFQSEDSSEPLVTCQRL